MISRHPAATGQGEVRPSPVTLLSLAAQLTLAGLVIHFYAIEGPAFLRLFLIACAGFAVTLYLRAEWRMPFFALLSIGAVFAVFEPADGAWLISSALLLIALCHLPVALWARVLVLLAAGGAFAMARAGVVDAPWSAAVWPILGSMFMFRLAIYLRALPDEPRPGRFWASLGYFFMLPNLVFPLFPVIDYQTFRRTHFDKDSAATYQQGLMWIARGLLHLVLYRLVYHRLLVDPVEASSLGELVQFMLSTFLLYLRVSGSFHLIVGLLYLFGFRLPETHKLYYLAHSFTELWRRINIYWKDFMMSFVFYPVYFKMKKLGPTLSVALATAAVFAMTWVLHSYQWFWLRGGFPVTLPDFLFWGLLGALVVFGALRELRQGAVPRPRSSGWSLGSGLRAFRTFTILCVLWSLWSAESLGQWLWMVGSAGEVDRKGVVLIAMIFGTIVLLGGRNWDATASGPRWLRIAQKPSVRTCATLALLFLLAHPALQRIAPAGVPDPLAAMRAAGINQHDARLRHRGYYEELDVRGQLTALTMEGPGGLSRSDWEKLETTGILRIRNDYLERDLVPSRSAIWRGMSFSTNRWGMRDRDYEREKPSGTLRIALLGHSVTMGNGVADGETFETLLEDRLNRDSPLGSGIKVEILNFAIDAYCLAQQVALLDSRVFDFAPDIVIATSYTQGPAMTERYLQWVAARGITLPYAQLQGLIKREGLDDAARGSLPLPFESWRRIARSLGLEPRMPYAEVQGRVHRISGDVDLWAIAHFAKVTRAHGAEPVMLYLDGVLDGEVGELPNRDAHRQAGLPIIDLLDVYPEAEHAALRIAPWDDHPNAAGHRLIADKMYPELLRILRMESTQP